MPLITVTEANKLIKQQVSNTILKTNNISGEVVSLTAATSGHLYFTLVDPINKINKKDAYLSCIIWKSNVLSPLSTGTSIIIKDATYNSYSGNYSVVISDYEVVKSNHITEKDLLKKLFSQLKKEGLFEFKKPFQINKPRNIAIVTSPTGSVIHDFITTISRRGYTFDLFLEPAIMQGDSCVNSIITALDNISTMDIDIVVIARGGGSKEDLNPFNEEILARYIANYSKPIISAVGHETDFTLLDYASNIRAATPTAAAELVSQYNYTNIITDLDNYNNYLNRMVINHIDDLSIYEQKLRLILDKDLASIENYYQQIELNNIDRSLDNNLAIIVNSEGNIIPNDISLSELNSFFIVRRNEVIEVTN